MKKFIKIGLFNIALMYSLFLLHTSIYASSDIGEISITINTGISSCLYGTSLVFTSHIAEYSSFSETGTFSPSTWSCTDYAGLGSWILTISSSLLTNETLHTIPAANIEVLANTNIVTSGSCTAGSNTTGWTSIDTPRVLIQKASTAGEICTISTTGVKLSINVPASQAVGTYHGVLTITLPSGF